MFDLQTRLDEHEERIAALEARTVSGVPDMSIADRFTALHDRVDDVGRNILKKIDKVRGELSTQMLAFEVETRDRFTKVETRLGLMDERLIRMDDRLDDVDDRLDGIDKRFEAVDQRFDSIDQRFEAVDKRLDRLDTQFGELRQDVSGLKQDVGGLKQDMGDIKAMLVGLGATAPGDRVN